MTYEERQALSTALRAERNRLEMLDRVWDVEDVLMVFEDFLEKRGVFEVKREPKK